MIADTVGPRQTEPLLIRTFANWTDYSTVYVAEISFRKTVKKLALWNLHGFYFRECRLTCEIHKNISTVIFQHVWYIVTVFSIWHVRSEDGAAQQYRKEIIIIPVHHWNNLNKFTTLNNSFHAEIFWVLEINACQLKHTQWLLCGEKVTRYVTCKIDCLNKSIKSWKNCLIAHQRWNIQNPGIAYYNYTYA